jgi:hypothetical protein
LPGVCRAAGQARYNNYDDMRDTLRLPVRLRRIIAAELVLVKTGPVLAEAGKR